MHVVVHCTRSYTLTNTWTLPLTYLGKERTHSHRVCATRKRMNVNMNMNEIEQVKSKTTNKQTNKQIPMNR